MKEFLFGETNRNAHPWLGLLVDGEDVEAVGHVLEQADGHGDVVVEGLEQGFLRGEFGGLRHDHFFQHASVGARGEQAEDKDGQQNATVTEHEAFGDGRGFERTEPVIVYFLKLTVAVEDGETFVEASEELGVTLVHGEAVADVVVRKRLAEHGDVLESFALDDRKCGELGDETGVAGAFIDEENGIFRRADIDRIDPDAAVT